MVMRTAIFCEGSEGFRSLVEHKMTHSTARCFNTFLSTYQFDTANQHKCSILSFHLPTLWVCKRSSATMSRFDDHELQKRHRESVQALTDRGFPALGHQRNAQGKTLARKAQQRGMHLKWTRHEPQPRTRARLESEWMEVARMQT